MHGPSPGSPDWTRDVIVRVALARCRMEKEFVHEALFVFPEGVVFSEKRRSTLLPNLPSGGPGAAASGFETVVIADRLARRSTRRIRWSEIARVECSYRCEAGFGRRRNLRLGRDLAIIPIEGEPVRMFLPYDDASRVIEAARFHLGERVVEDTEPFSERKLKSKFRVIEAVLAALPLLGALLSLFAVFAIVIAVAFGWARCESTDSSRRARRRLFITALIGAAPGLAILAGILLLFIVYAGRHLGGERAGAVVIFFAVASAMLLMPIALVRLRTSIGAFPRRRLASFPERPAQRAHWFERLCAYWPRPLRTRPAAITLRILGIAVFLAGMCLGQFLGIVGTLGFLEIYLQSIASVLAMVFVYLGYRANAESASRLLARDDRPPILFLRSFRDDGRGSFSISDWRATALGLQSVQFASVLGPLANANPIRILRLLIGRGGDTAEEQLAGYMRRHGPFIAIGRPKEGLPTSGAARDYVSDDIWRSRVEDWMSKARLIVIQPGATHGIWWEIERAIEAVPRDRVVFSILSFDGRPAEYEDFALRLRAKYGVDVPLYRGESVFLAFGRDGVAPITLRHQTPFLWPVRGCTADFGRMLGPLFGGRVAEEPARWHHSIRWPAAAAAAAAWMIPPALLGSGMRIAAGQVSRAIQIAELERAPFGTARRPISWSGLTWEGTDRFVLSSSPATAYEAPGCGIGGGIQPRERGTPVDLDVACSEVATTLAGPGAQASVRRRVTAGGLEWAEHRVDRVPTLQGESELVIRAAETPDAIVVHWALRALDLEYDTSAAFAVLLDSVKIAGWPMEGDSYSIRAPEGWTPVDPLPGTIKSFRSPDGDMLSFSVVAMSLKVSAAEYERLIRSYIQSNSPAGLRIDFRSFDAREPGTGTLVVDWTVAFEGDSGVLLSRSKTVIRGGWGYTATAESSRGDAALSSLEAAVDGLRVR